jgi:hypothetical protein
MRQWSRNVVAALTSDGNNASDELTTTLVEAHADLERQLDRSINEDREALVFAIKEAESELADAVEHLDFIATHGRNVRAGASSAYIRTLINRFNRAQRAVGDWQQRIDTAREHLNAFDAVVNRR